MNKAMNYCRRGPTRFVSFLVALFLFPAVGFVTMIAGIYVFIAGIMENTISHVPNIIQIVVSSCSLGISFILFNLSIKWFSMENRKYSINAKGIRIKDNRERFYSWDQISEVAIVVYAASASLQNYQTVICCLFRPRTKDFLRRILHSYLYGVMNQDNFVIIDYEPSIIEELSNVYPDIIADYRKQQLNGI